MRDDRLLKTAEQLKPSGKKSVEKSTSSRTVKVKANMGRRNKA
jgi:hypothetical protein